MDAVTSATTPNGSSAALFGASGGDEPLSSDFETFLKMLTAQMKNQDPLNPVDSTDYATQLATFSSVEQQVMTNDLLRNLEASLGGGALQQASSWIGMEALVRAPAFFDGSAIAIRPEYASNADNASLVVRDAAGSVVQRFSLDLQEDSLAWLGTDETGQTLPTGVYRFEVESYQGETLLDTQIAATYNRVTEVRSDNDNVMVRLAGGSEMLSTRVEGLRAPEE